ncbi:hypothetical protein [Corynebacterium comes]|uniref:Uncharacterized protein n=1 Tax=Corynebacterium comes TaxID=2675218 RepID=A0A6B8VZF9_9CORY|nr:hypothetical protein [Corynebacterium comes]QGU05097.1 hypothetical protein CETAM_09220 [Corynebacterium comes]
MNTHQDRAEQIAATIAKDMESGAWSPTPEFAQALADELALAITEGEGGHFNGVATLLNSLATAAHNSQFSD